MKNIKVLYFVLFILIISLTNCRKDYSYVFKFDVVTSSPRNITTTSIIVEGITKTNEINDILRMGVCWDTVPSPTVADSHLDDARYTKNFRFNISGLQPGTKYYMRPYAENENAIAYGQEFSFNTKIADIQGNTYKTVTIGNQVWMAENLNTTRYRNGDLIYTTTLGLSGRNAPKYQWAYGNNENYAKIYGRLYTWYTVTDSRNICPVGWHLPKQSELAALKVFAGAEEVAGGKLKEAETTHWLSPNTSASNEFGFSALPGGTRMVDGAFVSLGISCYLWSSDTETYNDNAWGMGYGIYYDKSIFLWGGFYKETGKSVRCVKD